MVDIYRHDNKIYLYRINNIYLLSKYKHFAWFYQKNNTQTTRPQAGEVIRENLTWKHQFYSLNINVLQEFN